MLNSMRASKNSALSLHTSAICCNSDFKPQPSDISHQTSLRFVQENESKSSYGVMRGLHFQRPPFTQSKLVRCVKGAVLDVAVDIRKGSPTYGQHVECLLCAHDEEGTRIADTN